MTAPYVVYEKTATDTEKKSLYNFIPRGKSFSGKGIKSKINSDTRKCRVKNEKRNKKKGVKKRKKFYDAQKLISATGCSSSFPDFF